VGQGGLGTPWIFKISEKNLIFLVSRGKKQISPLSNSYNNFGKFPRFPALEKIFPTPMVRFQV